MGMGQNFRHQETAGFSPCFHLFLRAPIWVPTPTSLAFLGSGSTHLSVCPFVRQAAGGSTNSSREDPAPVGPGSIKKPRDRKQFGVVGAIPGVFFPLVSIIIFSGPIFVARVSIWWYDM